MAGERTEAPTPRRREEARKQGQTSRSQDLTGAAVLLAGLYGIKILAGTLKDRLSELLVGNILAVGEVDKTAAPSMGTSVIGILVAILPPLLGVMALAALSLSVIQGDFMFVPGLLTPKLERVNPISGTKKILSKQGLIRLGKSFAKLAAVGLIGWMVIRSRLEELAGLGALELVPAINLFLSMAWELLFKSSMALLGLGILDWLLERRRFLGSIRMSKDEIKEENRQSEGDPHVRGQIRSRRMQFLQQMMKDVPRADVVVTNPTHFAVALKYNPEAATAPMVLAKGQDYLALRIRELARESGVPVLENPPLARALYKLTPVGKEIPPQLYVAVAEVLAFVFRLKNRAA